MKLDIATAPQANTRFWKNKKITWDELAQRLGTFQVTHETYSEYLSLPKGDQDKIKDVGGFVGGYLKGGIRSKKNIAYRQIVTLDFDYATPSFADDLSLWWPWESVLYSTHKHCAQNPRLRLVMPLSREVTPEEYIAVARWLGAEVGIDACDPTTFQAERLMFWPSRAKDAEYVFSHLRGAVIDADWVLSQYTDWRDMSEYAYPSSAGAQEWYRQAKDTQGDPTQKKGIVGIFCRTYPIEDAIQEFLSDVYEETAERGRYTYARGTSKGGLICYEDLFAYSYHASDPVSSRLCNAFDLVRVHKFGSLDEGKEASGTKAKSYKAMEEWALRQDAVKATALEESIDACKFESLYEETVSDDDWHKSLMIDRNGDIRSTAFNIRLIIRHDPVLRGKFAYNTFDCRGYLMDSRPGRAISAPEPLRDNDYSFIREYVETTYGISAEKKATDALNLEAERAQFHPVREYLDSLSWDGTERIATTLHRVFGADVNTYTSEVLLKWMVGAVRRIYEPGSKLDEAIILVGPQGCGKSTFIQKLGKHWYSDTMIAVAGKDAYEQIQGNWIMEIAELSAFKKQVEQEQIKHFMSKCEDEFRPAYGRCKEVYKRQCAFAGTTNDMEFLSDRQNRRYWPIVCNPCAATESVWDAAFDATVDQLWAEAVHNYHEGVEPRLSPAAEALVTTAREYHRYVDDRKGIVEQYLSMLLPADWSDRDINARRAYIMSTDRVRGVIKRTTVTALEIWCECFGKPREEATRYNTRDVNDIMRSMPNWTLAKGTRAFSNYGTQRYYELEQREISGEVL